MNPTLSPIFGPAGLGGGGGGGGGGAAGLSAASTTGGGAVAVIVSTTAGSGLGSVRRRRRGDEDDFFLDGRGLGRFGRRLGASRAATSGCILISSSSSHSAVILSSELEGTLAAAMPIALACARISLFSRPSFFEMSYIRTGINFHRRRPEWAIGLHGSKRANKNCSGPRHKSQLVAPTCASGALAGTSPTFNVWRSASARAAFKISAACSPICGMLLKSPSSADSKSSSRVRPA